MLFFKIRAIPLPSITLRDPFPTKDKLTLARLVIPSGVEYLPLDFQARHGKNRRSLLAVFNRTFAALIRSIENEKNRDSLAKNIIVMWAFSHDRLFRPPAQT
jgi:hypothetical protein